VLLTLHPEHSQVRAQQKNEGLQLYGKVTYETDENTAHRLVPSAIASDIQKKAVCGQINPLTPEFI